MSFARGISPRSWIPRKEASCMGSQEVVVSDMHLLTGWQSLEGHHHTHLWDHRPQPCLIHTSGTHDSLGNSRSTGVSVSGFGDHSQLIPPMALVKAGSCNLGTLRVTGSKELVPITMISCLCRPRIFLEPLSFVIVDPQEFLHSSQPRLLPGVQHPKPELQHPAPVLQQWTYIQLLGCELLVSTDLSAKFSPLSSTHLYLHFPSEVLKFPWSLPVRRFLSVQKLFLLQNSLPKVKDPRTQLQQREINYYKRPFCYLLFTLSCTKALSAV